MRLNISENLKATILPRKDACKINFIHRQKKKKKITSEFYDLLFMVQKKFYSIFKTVTNNKNRLYNP